MNEGQSYVPPEIIAQQQAAEKAQQDADQQAQEDLMRFNDEMSGVATEDLIGADVVPPTEEELQQTEESAIRRVEIAQGELENNWIDRLMQSKDDPEALVHFMSLINGRQFQELRITQEHGRQLNNWEQMTNGDMVFTLDEDGEVKHNIWSEVVHRGSRVVDRQALISAGLYGVAGLLSGGLGLAGGMSILARTVGRLGVEIASSTKMSKEGSARENIAEAMRKEWKDLQKLAREIQQDASLSEIDRINKLKDLVNKFYQTSSKLNWERGVLKVDQKEWDERRDKFGRLGANIGAAGGLSVDVVGMALNPSAADPVQFLKENGLGLIGVWVGNKVGKWIDSRRQKQDEKKQWRSAEEMHETRTQMIKDLDAAAVTATPAVAPEQAATPGPETSSMPAIPEKYQKLLEQNEKTVPAERQIWTIAKDDGSVMFVKIKTINWETGFFTADNLDRNMKKTEDIEDSLEDLIINGEEKNTLVNDWLANVEDDDEIVVPESVSPEEQIIDRSDITGQRKIKPNEGDGKYRVRRFAGRADQVILAEPGKPICRVNVFDLIINGINPIEPTEKREHHKKAPAVGEIWKIKDKAQLPAEWSALTTHEAILIKEIEPGKLLIVAYDQGKEGDILNPINNINRFVQLFEKIGSKGAQGKQEGKKK